MLGLNSATSAVRQQAIDETRRRDGDGAKATALAILYLADVLKGKKV